MEKTIERVKKRMVYRRGVYAAGRYVRFEEKTDSRIVALSKKMGVEVAEIVRIAVDDLLDNEELVRALRELVREKPPKVVAGQRSTGSEPHYVSMEELMPA